MPLPDKKRIRSQVFGLCVGEVTNDNHKFIAW